MQGLGPYSVQLLEEKNLLEVVLYASSYILVDSFWSHIS